MLRPLAPIAALLCLYGSLGCSASGDALSSSVLVAAAPEEARLRAFGDDGGVARDGGASDASTPEAGAGGELPTATAPADGLSARACALEAMTLTTLILAASPGEASQVLVTVPRGAGYRIELPEAAAGYAKLQVADWHVDFGVFASPGLYVELEGPESTRAALRNGSCDSRLSDARFVAHEWGTYTLRVRSDGPRTGTLIVLTP